MSSSRPSRNLAIVFRGTEKLAVEDIGYPKFEDPMGRPAQHAVIVKTIATNICGSDLHMYRGRTDFPTGLAFGHEITGEVVECGSEVTDLKVGDWISVPFNISCGTCTNCKERKTNFCMSVNKQYPGVLGGAYGYADMGGWQGGQAEYVLIPYADFSALKLPKDNCKPYILELAMLSDILPTAFNACVQAGVTVGRTVYIAGAGPVGICAAACALLLGAALVVVGDVNPDRLPNVEKVGPNIKTLDLHKVGRLPGELGKALEPIVGKPEVDCSIDAVGFEAHGHGTLADTESGEAVLNGLFHCTKSTGTIGIPGVYMMMDPRAEDSQHKAGYYPLQWGVAFNKGLAIQQGQCPVMAYHRELMQSILHDRISVVPALNVKVISLEEAVDAYKHFSVGEACKYVLDPHNILRSQGLVRNAVIGQVGMSADGSAHRRSLPVQLAERAVEKVTSTVASVQDIVAAQLRK